MKDVKHRRWAGHQPSVPTSEVIGSSVALLAGLAFIIFAFTVLPRMKINMSLSSMPSAKTLIQNEMGRVNNACAKGHQKECGYLQAASVSDRDMRAGFYAAKVGGVDAVVMSDDVR